jgi:hypothetical protein
LTSYDSIAHVLDIPSLQTIDVQHNKLDDVKVLDIFAALPDLRVLYLMGNPVVKSIRNYRRMVVARCKQLRYLDDRPVFDEERRRTEAWAKVIEAGGSNDEALEAERAELKLIRKEKDDLDEANFRAFEQLMKEGQEIRRLRELEESKQHSSQDAQSAGINPFSGEAIIPVPESEELRKIREARWGVHEHHVPPVPPTSLPSPPPSSSLTSPPPPSSASLLPSVAKDQSLPLPPSTSRPIWEDDTFMPPPPPTDEEEAGEEEEGGQIPVGDAEAVEEEEEEEDLDLD